MELRLFRFRFIHNESEKCSTIHSANVNFARISIRLLLLVSLNVLLAQQKLFYTNNINRSLSEDDNFRHSSVIFFDIM